MFRCSLVTLLISPPPHSCCCAPRISTFRHRSGRRAARFTECSRRHYGCISRARCCARSRCCFMHCVSVRCCSTSSLRWLCAHTVLSCMRNDRIGQRLSLSADFMSTRSPDVRRLLLCLCTARLCLPHTTMTYRALRLNASFVMSCMPLLPIRLRWLALTRLQPRPPVTPRSPRAELVWM